MKNGKRPRSKRKKRDRKENWNKLQLTKLHLAHKHKHSDIDITPNPTIPKVMCTPLINLYSHGTCPFSSYPITKALASKTHIYKTHQIPILLEKEKLINVHHHQLIVWIN